MSTISKVLTGLAILFVVALIALFIAMQSNLFGYVWHQVSATEIGVKVVRGQYVETVGPGVYDDWTPFADMINVSVEGLAFTASDPEVLTSDLQRLGVTVSGTVFRPAVGLMSADLWSRYRQLYLNDELLLERMTSIAQQAMKVCVGERTFEQAAVGTDRNDLTVCIDDQLSTMAAEMGLDVDNVLVPNVEISEAVQESLDAITASRQQTILAQQETLRIEAETQRDLATEQGLIQIEEGRNQERNRQRELTAQSELAALEAEEAVIAQQGENDLLTANANLEVERTNRQIAEEQAMAATAEERAMATLIQENPAYGDYLESQAIATAVSGAEMIIVPAGTNPLMMFGQNGLVPTLDVGITEE